MNLENILIFKSQLTYTIVFVSKSCSLWDCLDYYYYFFIILRQNVTMNIADLFYFLLHNRIRPIYYTVEDYIPIRLPSFQHLRD